MTVMLINWGSFDIPSELWSPFASPLFAETVGRFFFFGRSTNVHTFPWEEQSAQGGAVSILHATFWSGWSSVSVTVSSLSSMGPKNEHSLGDFGKSRRVDISVIYIILALVEQDTSVDLSRQHCSRCKRGWYWGWH
ncbi:hypothetical protein ACMFMG_000577 [Clarireedia jacksonii]